MDEWASFVRSLTHKYGAGEPRPPDCWPTPSRTQAFLAAPTPFLEVRSSKDDESDRDSALECCAGTTTNECAGESTAEGTTSAAVNGEQQEQASPTSVLRENDSTTSSSASSASGTSNGCHEMRAVNKLLADCGFPPVESAAQLYDTMVALVRDSTRREALVQELVQELDELRKAEEHNNARSMKLEAEVQVCRRRLAIAEQRSEMALCAAERANASLRKDLHSQETANLNLQQRCSQLEHNCRAKERAAEKYQHKLLEALQKEESQRSRGHECRRSSMMKAGKDMPDGKKKDNTTVQHVHVSLLEQVCFKLGLNAPTQLPNAVDALLKVNAAVPMLEQFVNDVCSLVLVSGKEFLPRANIDNPRQVPEVLRSWLGMLGD